MKKHTLLIFSLLGTIALLTAPVMDWCHQEQWGCNYWFGVWYDIAFFFPVLLFFSLISYKLPDRVFNAWWAFARWGIPVTFLCLFIFSSEMFVDNTHNGFMGLSLRELYRIGGMIVVGIIFIIISLVQMAWAFYRR